MWGGGRWVPRGPPSPGGSPDPGWVSVGQIPPGAFKKPCSQPPPWGVGGGGAFHHSSCLESAWCCFPHSKVIGSHRLQGFIRGFLAEKKQRGDHTSQIPHHFSPWMPDVVPVDPQFMYDKEVAMCHSRPSNMIRTLKCAQRQLRLPPMRADPGNLLLCKVGGPEFVPTLFWDPLYPRWLSGWVALDQPPRMCKEASSPSFFLCAIKGDGL